jgi:hypothetical protein
MPEKKTVSRARQDKKKGKSSSTQAGEFVREEMDHAKKGKHRVASKKQAIAIGLSKARRSGVDLKAPAKGKASAATRKKAERDRRAGAAKTTKRSSRAAATHRSTSRKRSSASKSTGSQRKSTAKRSTGSRKRSTAKRSTGAHRKSASRSGRR